MPYIITTNQMISTPASGEGESSWDAQVSRVAVATLDEAHDYVGTMTDDDATWNEWRRDISAEGGSVGPLPDGTIIEVEKVLLREIVRDVPGYRDMITPEIYAAFNAS